METLQLLVVCFLLLSTLLGDVRTEFGVFTCNENVTAEIGKDTNIICINNEKITDVAVKFCSNKTLCPNSSNISTFKKITTADNGRIALEINNTRAILSISRVQISDQIIYRFMLWSVNGHKEKDAALRVLDPVPSTSERVVIEAALEKLKQHWEKKALEKFKSENPISIILVPIFILLVSVFAAALYWRKKKGAIKLPWRTLSDVYHQPRFPEVSL